MQVGLALEDLGDQLIAQGAPGPVDLAIIVAGGIVAHAGGLGPAGREFRLCCRQQRPAAAPLGQQRQVMEAFQKVGVRGGHGGCWRWRTGLGLCRTLHVYLVGKTPPLQRVACRGETGTPVFCTTTAADATLPDPGLCGRHSRPSLPRRHTRRRWRTEIAVRAPAGNPHAASVHFRRTAYCLHAGIDTMEKLLPQAGPLALIPAIGLVDILRGLRRDQEFSGHTGSEPSVSPHPRKALKRGAP